MPSPVPAARRRRWTTALWLARLIPLLPLIALSPHIASFALGFSGSRATLATSAPQILGPAALFTLAGALAVGPLATLTGWRWHLILGRDLGLWTFVLSMLDMVIAMVTAESGWLDGIAGTAFLAAGSAAVLILLPLAVTSNRLSMKLLGKQWKALHKLAYAVVALIGVHLVLLVGLDALSGMLVLFGPSFALRVPVVRRSVVRWRTARTATSAHPR